MPVMGVPLMVQDRRSLVGFDRRVELRPERVDQRDDSPELLATYLALSRVNILVPRFKSDKPASDVDERASEDLEFRVVERGLVVTASAIRFIFRHVPS